VDWAELANLYRLTRPAALDHDRAKTGLKALVPEDAREAFGHGVRAKECRPTQRDGRVANKACGFFTSGVSDFRHPAGHVDRA
jgi:hypothetical protein